MLFIQSLLISFSSYLSLGGTLMIFKASHSFLSLRGMNFEQWSQSLEICQVQKYHMVHFSEKRNQSTHGLCLQTEKPYLHTHCVVVSHVVCRQLTPRRPTRLPRVTLPYRVPICMCFPSLKGQCCNPPGDPPSPKPQLSVVEWPDTYMTSLP